MNIPAFPQSNERVVRALSIDNSQGMTLRDYFAAQSIETVMQMVKHDLQQEDDFYWNEVHREIIAKRTYQMADAMLEARGE
jgi:hypothetical protein